MSDRWEIEEARDEVMRDWEIGGRDSWVVTWRHTFRERYTGIGARAPRRPLVPLATSPAPPPGPHTRLNLLWAR